MKAIKWTLSLVLTASLGLSSMSVFADTSSKGTVDATTVDATEVSESMSATLQPQQNESKQKVEPIYEPDTQVTIIVELNDNALIDYAKDIKPKEFLETNKAKNLAQSMKQNQAQVIAQMQQLLGSDQVSVARQYTTILNGFSVKTAYKNLEAIQKMARIERAFVAATYKALEPQMSSSVDMVGAPQVWSDKFYQGEGMVAAVLDTGLDTSHEAFQENSLDVSKARLKAGEMAQIFEKNDLNAELATQGLAANDTFVNTKVPFAYDYADMDTDVTENENIMANALAHGTHVSGIVAGNAENFKGMAPNAQLMMFKVYSSQNAETDDGVLIAALEDAVKIGVDVVNMSLGTDSGFSQDAQEVVNNIYSRIKDADIILDVAAGNSQTSSKNNNWGRNLTLSKDPDNGVVASPSTYDSALSIASVDNTTSRLYKTKVAGREIDYMTSDVRFDSLPERNYEYVTIPGAGKEDDYNELFANGTDPASLKGKVFLVKKSGLELAYVIAVAKQFGAAGVFIYDNAPGPRRNLSSSVSGIPAGFMTLEDGEFMDSQANKSLEIIEGVFNVENTETAGKPSLFSSRGTTNTLNIKPEVSAPGGTIYSAYPSITGQSYMSYSGTSMASPHVAGASAIIKQHLNKVYPDLAPSEVTERINQLLMSTASPVMGLNGYYPVRHQGAGLFNLNDALNAPSYLSVDKNSDGTQRPKIELGDDVNRTGAYTLSFNVTNTSNEAIKYAVDTQVTIPETEAADGQIFMKETNMTVPAVVEGDTAVTVEAGKTQKVTLKVTLDEQTKATIAANSATGSYVEGFVRLTPENAAGNDVKLSIPFLGFYGDWETPSMFDRGTWFDPAIPSSNYTTTIFSGNMPLGGNIIDPTFGEFNKDMLTLSPNNDGKLDKIDSVLISLLRNAKKLDLTIKKDGAETPVYQANLVNVPKTKYFDGAERQMPSTTFADIKPWFGKDANDVTVEDGRYTFEAAADSGYREGVDERMSFSLLVDTKAPILDQGRFTMVKENDRTYLVSTIKDENYMVYTAVASVYDGKPDWSNPLTKNYTPKEGVNAHNVKVDVTDLAGKQLMVTSMDSGMNERTYSIVVPETIANSLKLTDEFVTVAPNASHSLVVSGAATDAKLTWSSADSAIATVDQNGLVTGVKAGQTRITVTDDKGQSASALVGVVDIAKPTAITLSFENIEVNSNTEGVISIASIMPKGAPLDEKSTIWMSSDQYVVQLAKDRGKTIGFKVVGFPGEKADIVVDVDGIRAKATINVVDTSQGLIAKPNVNTIELGVDESIDVSVVDSNGEAIKWENANADAVSIDETNPEKVTLTGKQEGITRIVASSSQGSRIFNVVVKDKRNVANEVAFDKSSYTLKANDAQAVSVIFNPENVQVNPEDVTYRSLDETVARFDGKTIEALKAGETLIEATLANGYRAYAMVSVQAVEVDKQALKDALAKAEAIARANQTDASWQQLQDAIAAGKVALEDAQASDETVKAATDRLLQAMKDLVDKISGLPTSVTMKVGESTTLTATPAGGTWEIDPAFLSASGINYAAPGQASQTFKALKQGTTTISYILNGEKVSVPVTIEAKTTEVVKPDPEKPNPEKPDPEKPNPEKPNPEKPNPEVTGPGTTGPGKLPGTGVAPVDLLIPLSLVGAGAVLVIITIIKKRKDQDKSN